MPWRSSRSIACRRVIVTAPILLPADADLDDACVRVRELGEGPAVEADDPPATMRAAVGHDTGDRGAAGERRDSDDGSFGDGGMGTLSRSVVVPTGTTDLLVGRSRRRGRQRGRGRCR